MNTMSPFKQRYHREHRAPVLERLHRLRSPKSRADKHVDDVTTERRGAPSSDAISNSELDLHRSMMLDPRMAVMCKAIRQIPVG